MLANPLVRTSPTANMLCTRSDVASVIGWQGAFSNLTPTVVKNENGLHDVGDAVGAAAEFPQQTPALEGGQGLLADAADLGVGGVVPSLPPLEPTAPEGDTDVVAGALVCLVGPALESGFCQGIDDPVHGGGQVVTSMASRMQR